MAAAKEALELLSREPSAQRMVHYREDAAIERRLERAADGFREGEPHGRRAMTRALRECRFGAPAGDVVRRIDEALADDLAAWLGRALSAQTLADVFGDA